MLTSRLLLFCLMSVARSPHLLMDGITLSCNCAVVASRVVMCRQLSLSCFGPFGPFGVSRFDDSFVARFSFVVAHWTVVGIRTIYSHFARFALLH
jgi:hypothetical protein